MEEDTDLKQVVGGELVRRVLFPLLGSEYQHLHDRDALFELLVSAVPLSDRSCLDQLATRLGKMPHLLGKMISEERNSHYIRKWSKFLVKDLESMQDWTETAVSLAECCDSSHGVSHQTERWSLLKTLGTHLKLLKENRQLGALNQGLNAPTRILPQLNFRALEKDEKGTRRGSVTSPAALNLTPETIALLESLGVSIPYSERTLIQTIDQVETTETFAVLEAVISSFPCHLCFLRGYGNFSRITTVPAVQTNFEQRLEELDLDSFEGLLGSGLGDWKISLSARALKDLKQSKREGICTPTPPSTSN